MLLVSESLRERLCGARSESPFSSCHQGSLHWGPKDQPQNPANYNLRGLAPRAAPPGRGPCPLTMVWVYSWSLGSSYGRLAFFSRSDRNPWNAKGPSELPTQPVPQGTVLPAIDTVASLKPPNPLMFVEGPWRPRGDSWAQPHPTEKALETGSGSSESPGPRLSRVWGPWSPRNTGEDGQARGQSLGLP